MYLRQFFNEDGTIAYTEYKSKNNTFYTFKDEKLYGKDELINYFFQKLNFSSDDIVFIDRTLRVGKALIENKNNCRYVSVIHSEHYSKKFTNDDHIIWNHYNEYLLNNSQYIDEFIVSTETQKSLLSYHFENTIVSLRNSMQYLWVV